MPTPRISDEDCLAAVRVWIKHLRSRRIAAEELGISGSALDRRLACAAERGLVGYEPVMPGFRVTQASSFRDKTWVTQRPELEEHFEIPPGQRVKGVSALVDGTDRVHLKWVKTSEDKAATEVAMQAALEGFKQELPRSTPVAPPTLTEHLILNQYTVTDLHFGMLAWAEETRGDDYDIKIAEKLLSDWFTAAISIAPPAHTAVLAQLGDLLHYDSLKSETPEHKNVLDADSRFQKIVRVVIQVFRHVVSMLLQKHHHVHIIMCSANHDPASSAWMREMFNVVYENEPRVTVEISPSEYYSYEWGNVALFYHHGHRRKLTKVDDVFAGMFRELYGRCQYSYGHIGHLHSDEMVETNLMKVERHRTLAPTDAFGSSRGHLPKRDAKVISYHKQFGEVSRITLSPQMVSQ